MLGFNMKLTIERVPDADIPEHEKSVENPHYHVILGGDSSNPSWDRYLDKWDKDWHGHFVALKDWIASSEWHLSTGRDQNDHTFKFSDGHMFAFSMRAWGDFMQAIVGKNEGYMQYYM